jgi:hypothetical protein
LSRNSRDIDVLKRIVEVRRLQERVSEQALAESTLKARATLDAEQSADRRLTERQAAWLGAVRRPRFEPYLMAAFTEAVQVADQSLVRARNDVAEAEMRRDEQGAAFQRAEAHTEAAEQIHDAAQRLARRRKEDSRLNETADSTARRRPAT